MLSNATPCQSCEHRDICKYRDEACAAHYSLERGSYNVPEHSDRAPGDQNTAILSYKASKFLTFTVHCKYFTRYIGVLSDGRPTL